MLLAASRRVTDPRSCAVPMPRARPTALRSPASAPRLAFSELGVKVAGVWVPGRRIQAKNEYRNGATPSN
jgi:hypothetical protein